MLVDAKVRYDFYDARIPAGITNGPAFEKWVKYMETNAAPTVAGLLATQLKAQKDAAEITSTGAEKPVRPSPPGE